jgi:branched-chain amino acid transport system substrate-binding protein
LGTVHTLKQAVRLDGLSMALYYHHDLTWPGDNGFAGAFQEKNRQPPCYQSALAYDALMLLHQAVLEGARTREDIRKFLASLSDDRRPFQGVAGPIFFNENQEVIRWPVLGILRNGQIKFAPTGEPFIEGGTR